MSSGQVSPDGRYVRKQFIGKGSFKRVYRAFDETLALQVAWNEVPLDTTEREVALLARLKHPNIACIGVYPGPTATDMTAGSPVALADPMQSARQIVAGMMAGETSIFPDPAARDVESVVGASIRALEARFATLLSE